MTVEILDEAQNDLVGGFRFYQRREKALGTYFRSALFGEIEGLAKLAGIQSKMFGHHRTAAKRFPFAIYYYKVKKERILMHAVLDCRRDPRSIQRTLKKRSGE